MNQAIDTVIDYLFHNGEQENFIEYMTEEKGRNPKEHIFYSALVMRYNGDENAVLTWMCENIPQKSEDKGMTVENLSYLIQDEIAEAQHAYVEDGEIYTIPNIYANAKKMRTYLQTAEMFLCRNNKFFGVSLKYNNTKYCIEFALTKYADELVGFENCEDCGYIHHYEDKCPKGEKCKYYQKCSEEDDDEDEEDFDNQWYIGSLENDDEIICWSSYEAAGTAILKKKPTVARNSQ
jgi:hypothetical protein